DKGPSSGQSRNRAVRDVVAARDLAHRLAIDIASTDRLAPLMLGQFRFAAELDAAGPGALATLAGAGAYQTECRDLRCPHRRLWTLCRTRLLANQPRY